MVQETASCKQKWAPVRAVGLYSDSAIRIVVVRMPLSSIREMHGIATITATVMVDLGWQFHTLATSSILPVILNLFSNIISISRT